MYRTKLCFSELGQENRIKGTQKEHFITVNRNKKWEYNYQVKGKKLLKDNVTGKMDFLCLSVQNFESPNGKNTFSL